MRRNERDKFYSGFGDSTHSTSVYSDSLAGRAHRQLREVREGAHWHIAALFLSWGYYSPEHSPALAPRMSCRPLYLSTYNFHHTRLAVTEKSQTLIPRTTASSLTLALVRQGDGGKGRTRSCTKVKREATRSIHYTTQRMSDYRCTITPQHARDCALEALDVKDEGNLGARIS